MSRWRTVAVVIIIAVIVGAALFDPKPRAVSTLVETNSVLPPTLSAPDAKSDVWFCAGGTAIEGGAADVRIALVNTSDSSRTATIAAVGTRAAGTNQRAAASKQVSLAAYARAEVRLADLVPGSAYAAATVELTAGGVVVEQSVSGPTGFDRGPCSSVASQEWFVPISATATAKNPTARALLVLYNPYADAAVVNIDFSTDRASAAAPIESMVVPPRAVESVDITAAVPVAPQVSIAVRARAGRIVADRIEIFDEPARRDLVLTQGIEAPATVWFFPSGRIGNARQERLVVYNPGDDRASVVVEVRPDNPAVTIEPFDLEVSPGQTAQLDLQNEKRLTDVGVTGYSVVVRSSDHPVVAERMVIVPPGQPGAGASSTFGSAFAAPLVYVDSTATGDGNPSELAIFNPNARAIARVKLEMIVAGARRPAGGENEFDLQPGERKTLPLAQLGPSPLTVIINASAPVVAEREIVGNANRAAAMGILSRRSIAMPKAVTLDLGE